MRAGIKKDPNQRLEHSVDIQDVNRLLEVGKLLSSVLTEEELKALHEAIMPELAQTYLSSSEKVGNTSVS